jgi:hypothetical protein
MRKLIFIALLTTHIYASANDEINYNYLELGYDYFNLSGNNHADGLYLNGAFDLSDRFYLGGYYNNLSTDLADSDRYGLFLGFHTDISNNTDFYSNIRMGQIDTKFFDSFTYGAEFGTRTAFNEHFELITLAAYNQLEKISDGYLELGVKGLFKFNNANSITAGVSSLDGDLGANIGYRFSF